MRGVRSGLLITAVVAGMTLPCFALGARISGRVSDSQNSAIQGASVRVVDQATGIERESATNADGLYDIPFLLPGIYQIYVQAPGFSTAVSPNFTLDSGQVLWYDLQLRIGSVSETVHVEGAPQLMQTESASVGQVISTHAIDQTPLNGRNWVYIAQFTAGVAPPEGSRGNGKGDFNANGQRAEQNNFLLDGVDNNTSTVDFLNGSSFVVRPPPDALAEFTIQTSNYSAEFGHSAGAVVNASLKSGTNELHGGLWEYLRNNALDARDWESATVPRYRENQFGATLGFPFVKNRLFFFGDIEANRVVFQETNYLTVPTAMMRQGNFTELLNGTFNGTGKPLTLTEPGNPAVPMGANCGNPQNVLCAAEIDPVARNLLNLYPSPNANTSEVFTSNYIADRMSTDNTFQFDTRMDWNIRASDQVFARISLLNEPGDRSAPLGPVMDGGNFTTFGDDGHIANLGDNFAFGFTHAFPASLTNDLHLGYNRGRFAFSQENATNTNLAASFGLGGIPAGSQNGGLPTVNIGGLSGFGSPEFYPANESQDVLQVLDDLDKSVGPHNMKFGLSFLHIHFSTEQPPTARGEYDFYSSASMCSDSITYTGYGAADFLSNSMGCAELSNIGYTDNVRWDRAAYAQDDWKIHPRLTLNFGVRYEYPQTYRELNGRQAEWYPVSPPSAGNTQSIYRLPAQSAQIALGASFPALMVSNHVALQYSDSPYLVTQGKIDLAPRVGLSYMLNDHVVARAGFGMFYGGLENIGYSGNLGNNPPFIYQSSFLANAPNGCQVNSCPTDGLTLENGFSASLSAGLLNSIISPSLRGMDNSVRTPYAVDYNLAFQFGIARNLAATFAYVGSESHHLIVFTNPNAPVALQTNGADQSVQQPLPGFGSAIFSSYTGVGSYNSLQVSVERRFNKGLNFLGTYTYSHALDDAPTPLGSNGDNGYPNTNIQSIRGQYSNSPFDVRQRFTLNGNYRFPSLHNRMSNHPGWSSRNVWDGWSLSLSFAAQSGNPFSVTPDFSVFHPASGATIVYATKVSDPFRAGGMAPVSNSDITCPTSVRTRLHWYNPCAFGNPLSGTTIRTGEAVSGSAALAFLGGRRNDVYGPGYQRVNISLFKNFAIASGQTLQFRVDIFNLFNTPSYANPNSNSSGGGVQSGINTNSSDGGQITLPRFFQDSTPDARFFQFALKFNF
jgi:hypothetical protein